VLTRNTANISTAKAVVFSYTVTRSGVLWCFAVRCTLVTLYYFVYYSIAAVNVLTGRPASIIRLSFYEAPPSRRSTSLPPSCRSPVSYVAPPRCHPSKSDVARRSRLHSHLQGSDLSCGQVQDRSERFQKPLTKCQRAPRHATSASGTYERS
jgi:hypothetical protein